MNVLRTTGLLLCLAVLIAAGCAASGWNPTPVMHVVNMTGIYLSEEPLGNLGIAMLELERNEGTRTVYTSRLSSYQDLEAGQSDGLGTLGDTHLILNFDRGFKSDFYFEGTVEFNGDTTISITGQFVFPDQAGTIPVVFHPLVPAQT